MRKKKKKVAKLEDVAKRDTLYSLNFVLSWFELVFTVWTKDSQTDLKNIFRKAFRPNGVEPAISEILRKEAPPSGLWSLSTASLSLWPAVGMCEFMLPLQA